MSGYERVLGDTSYGPKSSDRYGGLGESALRRGVIYMNSDRVPTRSYLKTTHEQASCVRGRSNEKNSQPQNLE